VYEAAQRCRVSIKLECLKSFHVNLFDVLCNLSDQGSLCRYKQQCS
jgi:hypothetical protein